MAVKVYCSICDKFIKDIEQSKIDKLNGKEICEDCGKRVREAFDALDQTKSKHMTEITKRYNKTKDEFAKLDTLFEKYKNEAKSLYSTSRAELQARLDNILLNEDQNGKNS